MSDPARTVAVIRQGPMVGRRFWTHDRQGAAGPGADGPGQRRQRASRSPAAQGVGGRRAAADRLEHHAAVGHQQPTGERF